VQKKLYPLKGYLRRRSPENVVTELGEAKRRYGFDLVRFSDDNFCYDPDWLDAFAPLYADKVKIPFWIFMHPSASNERTIRALKTAGCLEVEMGIQTLEPEVRTEVIHRKETEAEIIQAIRMLRQAGIRCTTDFIINLPGHTEESLVEAIRFFTRHRPHRVNTFWINYYPRLDITRLALDRGTIDQETEERICRGYGVHTFFQGGTVFDLRLARLQILFSLLHVVPEPVLKKILDRRLYRSLPFLGFKPTYFVMYMLSYLTKEKKNDLYLRRFKMRYRTYMQRRLRERLGLGRRASRGGSGEVFARDGS